MSGTRILWTVLLVAAGAGGVYLADRMVLAPGRALQQQLAERDAQIRTLTERTQALEAAVRLLRHTERRARLLVLDQGPGPEGHIRTRVRFTELDGQGDTVGEPRELVLDGDEVYIDALVIKFEDTFVTAGDALKGKALLLFRQGRAGVTGGGARGPRNVPSDSYVRTLEPSRVPSEAHATPDGFLRAWLNGRQVTDYRGPIGYTDDLDRVYFKMGLYRDNLAFPMTMLVARFRRGASRAEVDPAASP